MGPDAQAGDVHATFIEKQINYNYLPANLRNDIFEDQNTLSHRRAHSVNAHIPRYMGSYPSLNSRFTGQEEQLDKIKQKLLTPPDEGPSIRISLYGLGGIGKTYLATYFFHHPIHAYPYRVWLAAEDIKLLQQQFRDFVTDLNLVDKKQKISDGEVKKTFFDYIQQHPGWLLVYDNVNHSKEIQSYIPQRGCHVLITTRQSRGENSIKVLIMKEDSSIILLKKYTYPEGNSSCEERYEDEFKKIVRILGNLPLAIAQAGAYMHAAKITPIRYHEEYLTRKADRLKDNHAYEDHGEHEPVYITWDISIEQISKEQKNAVELLNLLVCLGADNIPRVLIKSYYATEDLICLEKYSLLTLTEENISIHRVLRDVVQEKQKEKLTHHNYLRMALSLLEEQLSYDRDSTEKLNYFKQLIPHVEALLLLCDEASFTEMKVASLYYKLGIYYFDFLNEVKKAEACFEKSLQLTHVLDVDENGFVRNLQNKLYRQLAKIAIYQKRYDLAEDRLSKCDENDPKILCDLAILFLYRTGYMKHQKIDQSGQLVEIYSREKTAEFLKKAKHYLDRADQVIPDDQYSLQARVYHLLGNYFCKLNQFKKAEDFYRKALVRKQHIYKDKCHTEIARTLEALSSALLRCNTRKENISKIEEAKGYLQQALDIKKRYYGTSARPEILGLLIKLGSVCKKIDEKAEAQQFNQEADELKRQGVSTKIDTARYHAESLLDLALIDEAREVLTHSYSVEANQLRNTLASSSQICGHSEHATPQKRMFSHCETDQECGAKHRRLSSLPPLASQGMFSFSSPFEAAAEEENISGVEEPNFEYLPNIPFIQGLEHHKVPGDGHCFYHAVGLPLREDQQSLRMRVAAHIEKNKDDYSGQIKASIGIDVTEYIQQIRNGQAWADNFEIAALMRVLNRPIIVIDPAGKLRHTGGDQEQFTGAPIFIYFNGHNHYDSWVVTQDYQGREHEIVARLARVEQVQLQENAALRLSPSTLFSSSAERDELENLDLNFSCSQESKASDSQNSIILNTVAY